MITHNRPGYTALSLPRLCDTVPEDAKITVWDNGSSNDMLALLKQFEKHPRIERIVYNQTNEKLRGPTNWFWHGMGEAEFLSKVDDDGLMPNNWCEVLSQAHMDVPQFGILGTWCFMDEDFDEKVALKKIQIFGYHRLLRNCWVGGSGYLIKRAVIEKIGFIRNNESFTSYCIRAEAAGFVNGWYYPFLWQEHMDDPRSPHTGIKTEEDFQRLRPLTATTFSIRSIDDWVRKQKELAQILQICSFDPEDYIGWRAKLRRRWSQLLGKPYVPKIRTVA